MNKPTSHRSATRGTLLRTLLLLFVFSPLFSANLAAQFGAPCDELSTDLGANDTCYQWDFTPPQHSINTVSVDYGDFNIIEFDEAIPHLDFYDEYGYPMLPFVARFFPLPDDVTSVMLEVDDPEYECPTNSGNASAQNNLDNDAPAPPELPYIYLDYDYMPSQSGDTWCYNAAFYASNGLGWEGNNSFYRMSEVFEYMDTKWVCVVINLFNYNPDNHTLLPTPELNLKIRVHTETTTSLSDYVAERLITNRDIDNLYDIPCSQPTPLPDVSSYFNYNYAIVTTSEFIDNGDLQRFADHKRDLGYTVYMYNLDVESNPRDSFDIANFLQTVRNERSLRYALIVGAPEKIALAQGNCGDLTYAPSDWRYAAFDYSPGHSVKLHVGRWPVTNDTELANIVEKTIHYENSGYYREGALLAAGVDDGSVMQEQMNEALKAAGRGLRDAGIHYQPIYGNDGNDGDNLISNLTSEDYAIFVYSGHGNREEVGPPYNTDYTSFNNSSVYVPFAFAMACQTNEPFNSCQYDRWFGKDMLVNTPTTGFCSFFGSTSISMSYANVSLSGALFHSFKSTPMTISDVVYAGLVKYYKRAPFFIRRHQVWKYSLLLGDPSLYICDADYVYYYSHLQRRYNMPPQVGHTDVENESSVNQYLLYQLTGQVVYTSDQPLDTKNLNLPDGVYLLKHITDKSSSVRKIIIGK